MRNVRFSSLILLLAGVAFSAWFLNELNAAPDTEKNDTLTLQVAVALAEHGPLLAKVETDEGTKDLISGPILVFTRTNNSNRNLVVDEPGVGSSPIVIIKPNGEEVRSVVYVSRQKNPDLGAKQTIRERRDIFGHFTSLDLDEPGTYKIYWTAMPEGSKTVYKSNTILIYKDEKTPSMDKTTGRPKPKP